MNQYNPDEHRAATVLTAYTALGSAISALHEDLRTQRERADDYTRTNAELCAALDAAETDVAKLRLYVAQLEALLDRDMVAMAANNAAVQWNRQHGISARKVQQ